MQPSSQAGSSCSGRKSRRDAAVGGHRAAAVRGDERDDRPGASRDERALHLDAVGLQAAGGEGSRVVVRANADEAGRAAQLRHPGGDVRRLPARAEPRHGVCVRALGERLREADDHVQQEVAERHEHQAYDPPMDGESRRSRTRSFLVGAAVGASAAIAAARRLRPKERKRETPAGLAAFEDAPCYRELVESERSAP